MAGSKTTETTQRSQPENLPGLWRLHVISGDQLVVHPLPPRGVLTVGRSPEADLCIDHRRVSRLHARLHLGAVITIEDLGSRNGVCVGGKRLAPSQRVELRVGDVVELGSSMLLLQPSYRGGPSAEKSAPTGAAAVANAVGPSEIVVVDEVMVRLHRLLDRVAPTAMNVLLLGETGVGKEVFARALHDRSPRARHPFLGLNCAALSETLLESELFGHEKGAFSGALHRKPGLLEAAAGGTVFLDEVGELPPGVQARLLRVLETREALRVGGLKPYRLEVRFVAATNRDLEAEVARRSFRPDLFFRLNGFSVVVPPLRERRGEIAPLARAFLAEASRRNALAARPTLTDEALARLLDHDWPGNLRELRNVVERAMLLAEDGVIEPAHLQLGAASSLPPRAGTAAPRLDRASVVDALERAGGNQGQAAKLLGISRRTLIYRLEAYGLPRPRKRL